MELHMPSPSRWIGLLALTALLAMPVPLSGAASPAETEDEVEQEQPAEQQYLPRQTETAPLLEEAPVLALRGPVDDERYIVGPGDELSISIWGKSTLAETSVVSPEGELVLPGVAPVPVAGKSLREAKAAVTERLLQFYRNGEISVSLTGLRSIRVNVLGDVYFPGEYTGTALDLAGAMIEKAGGIGTGASSRGIVIRRRGGKEERVDLMKYMNAGDMDANPPILDGDVIYVPSATSKVHIEGAVAWPGDYDLVEGDSIESLIALAGGFNRDAVTDTVQLHRFVDDRTTALRHVNMSGPEANGLALMDGDQIYVKARPDYHVNRRVFVEGEVERPGPYGINEGVERLTDVLARAGGPTERASLIEARVFREIPEEEVDPEFERLAEMSAGSMSSTEYSYWTSRLREQPGAMSVNVAKALDGDESHDVLLRDGDRIVLPRASMTVRVSGQVADPGLVPYVPDERYTHYIRAAGGYGSGARRGAVRLIRRSNGRWVRASRAGVVRPGDEVWVPEREEGAVWELIKDVAQLAASLATAYLLIDQATN